MKTYKFIAVLIFTLMVSLLYGQQCEKGMEKGKREKIQAQKIAFITEKLNLTPEEAQVFWPVYNELEKKRDAIHVDKMKKVKCCDENYSTLSKEELEKIADSFVEIDLQDAKLAIDYNGKFKKILPIDKVVKLYHAEHQFKNHLLKQMKERKNK